MKWEKLPLLKSSFFANLEVATIHALLKAGNFWTPQMMPVGLWENAVIIATSTADVNLPEVGFPSIQVRAHAEDLKRLYEMTVGATTTPETSVETSNELTTPTLSFADLTAEESTLAPQDTNTELPAKEPAFQTLSVDHVQIDFSSLANEETKPFIAKPIDTKHVDAVPQPPPPPQEDSEEVTKRFVVEPLLTKTQSTGKWDLQVFLRHFDKVMFLEWKGSHLEVSKWLGPWQINPHANRQIDVSGNSIFRVPLKSTYPYHGYVVANAINDSFFQNFNNGKVPEHVTVFPVYENNVFAGEILCITTKLKGERINLQDFEPYLSLENSAIAAA